MQNLNEDLNKINHWAFQWKMSFNPDPFKHAQEVIFSCKLQKSSNISVIQSTTQKHLGILLKVKVNFQGHSRNIYSKVNKTIDLLRKLHITSPRLRQFINLLLDLILIKVRSCMIKHIQLNFTKIQNLSNKTQHQLLQVRQEGNAKRNLIKSQVWKPFKKKDGTENCAVSLIYSKNNVQIIYAILFLLP